MQVSLKTLLICMSILVSTGKAESLSTFSEAIDLNSDLVYKRAADAIRSASKQRIMLHEGEIFEFLDYPLHEHSNDPRELTKYSTLKNDLIDRLIFFEIWPTKVASSLFSGSRVSNQDPVWRDYCLQKLDSLYFGNYSSQIKSRAVEILSNRIKDHAGSLDAGTAAITLTRIIQDQVRHSDWVLEVIASMESSLHEEKLGNPSSYNFANSLITLGYAEEARAWARRVVSSDGGRDGARSIAGALGVLGRVAEESDLLLVEAYLSSMDFRVRRAASHAKQSIEAGR